MHVHAAAARTEGEIQFPRTPEKGSDAAVALPKQADGLTEEKGNVRVYDAGPCNKFEKVQQYA